MLASVIVPVRNRPDQIGPAVESLLRQTTRDLEVIVVDDASTDSTVTVAKAIADPRVTVIELEASLGPSGARNAGARLATGELIGFLDSDDAVESTWLAHLAEPFSDASVVVACCGYRVLVDGEEVRRQLRLTSLGPAFHNLRGCFQAGTFLIRRPVFEAVGGYVDHLRYGENTELSLRLCDWVAEHDANVAAVEEALLHWNLHDRGAYSAALRADGARYTLEQHGHLLALDPFLLSNHHAIIATGEAHDRKWRAAQSHFFQAWRALPTNKRAIARLLVSLAPIWRTRQWP